MNGDAGGVLPTWVEEAGAALTVLEIPRRDVVDGAHIRRAQDGATSIALSPDSR